MTTINRRDFIKILGIGASASVIPELLSAKSFSQAEQIPMPKGFYDLPMQGSVRFLHMTDIHGQLNPVYFREPNVNLGVGQAFGKPPHIVGKKLLKELDLKENSPEAYAYTYLNFDQVAKKYGPTGGFPQLMTLLKQLRQQAGGQQNTITLDGGDLWQGTGSALWTRGMDMVEATNILGVDVMVGHWEFTYEQEEVLRNIAAFKGEFLGQNVRIKEASLFGDAYPEMVEKFDGIGLYNEDSAHAFKPYSIKEVNGARIAIIGQAFPRTANANPQEFFPDWSFGLREEDMIELAEDIQKNEKPDAMVMLSHNGMDVDIKMAQRVPGLNAVLGGHTHDGMPEPVKVKNADGGLCLVTNAGSNGKFVGVMDFDFKDKKLNGIVYRMVPVISNWLDPDKEMSDYIQDLRNRKYDNKIVESRAEKYHFSKAREGKTYAEILDEKLAIADRTLYRRGNFMGTWDQVICNALREEYKADIAMSAGVRWGTTTLKGDWITMEDVMTQCALTYGETYVMEMKGKDLIAVLEGVADNLFDPDPYLQSGGDMVRIGGLDYSIDPSKKLYHRLSNVRLDNGHKIEAEESYKVAGWATVNRTPEGRLIWDIVRDYILNNKGKDNVLKLEKINHPELIGVSENPGIADYPGKLIG